jgi:hypothetical protein
MTLHFRSALCRPHLPLLVVTALLVSACVTINIYFPAAAAEKAADRIIDDVWQLSGESGSNGNPSQVEEGQ